MMVFCVCIFYRLVYTSACGEASIDSSCDFLFYLRHYSQTATSVDPDPARMDFTRARCGSTQCCCLGHAGFRYVLYATKLI